MLQQLGFTQHSVSTRLGEMVYVTAKRNFWEEETERQDDHKLPTLVFL